MIQAKEIVEKIKLVDRIVITSHFSPDGDSVGSSVGLYHFIQALGKSATICHPDPCHDSLEWLKEGIDFIDFENDEAEVVHKLRSAELIFCLDYNGIDRVGSEMKPFLEASDAFKIMIDHHPYPGDFVNICVSNTAVGSTCELIYELIDHSGNQPLLNPLIAQAIYLGIVTDSGSFRYASVSQRTHEIAGVLLNQQINHAQIHERLFDNVSLNALQLRGYATSAKLKLVPDYPIAYVELTEEELKRFHARKGDTDGLVNMTLAIQGVEVAVLFVEKEGMIKLSFRSHGTIAVNRFAIDVFSGGGHLNAAGGISTLSLQETVALFLAKVPTYFKELRVA